jgi:hypothetical protein
MLTQELRHKKTLNLEQLQLKLLLRPKDQPLQLLVRMVSMLKLEAKLRQVLR